MLISVSSAPTKPNSSALASKVALGMTKMQK